MLAEITRNWFTRVNMWYDMRGGELNMKEGRQMHAFSAGHFFFKISILYVFRTKPRHGK